MRTSNLSLLNYLEYTILNRSMGYTYMRCTYRVGSMDVQGTRVSARVYLKIVQTIAFWSNSSGKEKKWELSDLSNRNVSNVARKKSVLQIRCLCLPDHFAQFSIDGSRKQHVPRMLSFNNCGYILYLYEPVRGSKTVMSVIIQEFKFSVSMV